MASTGIFLSTTERAKSVQKYLENISDKDVLSNWNRTCHFGWKLDLFKRAGMTIYILTFSLVQFQIAMLSAP